MKNPNFGTMTYTASAGCCNINIDCDTYCRVCGCPLVAFGCRSVSYVCDHCWRVLNRGRYWDGKPMLGGL